MSEHIEITVSVPLDRQAEFYKWFGMWLEGAQEDEPGDWRRGSAWTADDQAVAVTFYRTISPTARRILKLWAGNDGQWTSGEATAIAAEVNGPRGVAGSLSSVGKTASKLSKQLPFEYEPGEAGSSGRYRVSPLVAELFRTASSEVAS